MTALAVVLGAAVGAPLRYLIGRALNGRFPHGTLVANATGSALLGFLVALPADSTTLALLGTGFCGALTTYSTFSLETLRLIEDRRHGTALLNITASLALGLAAAYAGMGLATTFG
ncbi:fluoride efflux transporter CrcB [Umezawaea sp. Da 62-37]|uniref:fluoride efflux transporter CrcB n=1 Tax=Umezawaea sp. Da 62-37 TaxID=3075927 RepID=UPI0028F6E03D|nr:fluoride efflux transporter CrcB [Umezawaea sp. Da 62-37]WNV83431.1 fluoride efflux transporter CrcB [Umezawaea sp. Da 62-37]